MRWGRYGVKSARRIARSSCPIGRWSGAIAFDASGKISNVVKGARSGHSPFADNDVAIAGIGEILLPVGEAEGARPGMIRFSV